VKVITLKQPWATLVAENIKKYEFRTWKYNYRGEILIHAGAGVDIEAMKKVEHLNLNFPSKKILAKVIIEDCIKLNEEINKNICIQNPLIYGDKNRTGYACKLGKVTKLSIDEEIPGKQGIWNYNIE
jgi:hypothetical protein